MPTTRSVTVRGIKPNGDSDPCGVISVMVSPTNAPSAPARSWPMTMPGRSPSAWVATASKLPPVIAPATSVTSRSSTGSMPLMVMNMSLRSLDTSALP